MGLVAGIGLPESAVAGRCVPPVAPSQDRRGGGSSEWPLRSFLELGALPGAVPCARLHARQLTWEWRLAGLSEDIELLVSELVTNAVQASRSLGQAKPVRMWLLSDSTRVLILVWDACRQPPVRMDVGQEAEGGRGLLLVETISSQWDWYATQEREGGKVVWALSVLR
jgi:anti-sigma regulatory factor (Ser/Thr protein kinase)